MTTVATLIEKSKASDAELAADTGLHVTLIWKYRTGVVRQPKAANLMRLFVALQRRGVSVDFAALSRRKRAA